MYMKRFRRAYCPNPSPRFDAEALRVMADELVYVCDTPIFDDMVGPENAHRFEGRVLSAMKEFDPNKDVIVFFGDALIYAMMVFAIAMTIEDNEKLTLARYSIKSDRYVLRTLSASQWAFDWGCVVEKVNG